MKLLAVNTSSILSAALFSREGVLAERNFFDKNQYKAEDLPRVLEELLPAVGWQPGEITHIAVAIGPGGYTGLRSGLALAKTLAQMNNLPLIGVNSLEAMAVLSPSEGFVVPLLDAKMKEINWALYKIPHGPPLRQSSGQALERGIPADCLIPPTLSEEERVFAETRELEGPITFLGTEPLPILSDDIRTTLGERAIFPQNQELHYPLARGVGLIALQKIEQGETTGWKELEPFYARPPVL